MTQNPAVPPSSAAVRPDCGVPSVNTTVGTVRARSLEEP